MNQRQEVRGRRGKNGDGAERHEAIHRAISDAIIEHRLKPGARLREDALAEVFGVSRTGIRKILQRLALEQLVTLTPRRGASVTRPTAEEAREVFEARQMVECGLMPEVARRIDEESVHALREISDKEQRALRKGEHSAAIRYSADFHTRLARLAGNATLADFVERLCFRSSLILAVYGKPGHLGCETHDHEDLIGYLQEKSGERAAAFMSRHLKAIEESLSITEEEEETPDLQRIFAG
ncbi:MULTISPECIES: GntR family transcriptional regulator [Halomonas]|uniref:GntR family transcriptional regulator n=1 Tax=Halomonas marinisediminis TaxID=2546095 RepID=A0ABY2D4K5_9GAMM|nr:MULTISPECIES: GntR family transcriptional regulator [Halomonas]MBF7055082.1 GntR family transcriptional regulator [Halomonas sp. KAO]MDT0502551.1 GntR family transcriptional regulator [Halomonas sp. PAR7]MDT0512976.1 GntR family transcriptional regulator [Halomonas sp. LES1]MDT0591199.1 GntR family transcriptional regulator [Halomonas sp. PAR8]TDB01406.1 GntR family transcriptional regulator [Halomonas marinisediminis]